MVHTVRLNDDPSENPGGVSYPQKRRGLRGLLSRESSIDSLYSSADENSTDDGSPPPTRVVRGRRKRRSRSMDMTSSFESDDELRPLKSQSPARRQLRRGTSFVVGFGLGRKVPVTVYYDGQKLGQAYIRIKSTVERARAALRKEFDPLRKAEFCFWYSNKTCKRVHRDDENRVKTTATMDDDSTLHVRSRAFMRKDNKSTAFMYTEEQLQDLVPEAESVVRCCVRLLEDSFPKDGEQQVFDPNLPNQAISCSNFVKDVARACVDSTSRAQVSASSRAMKWQSVERALSTMQDVLRSLFGRDVIGLWWFYCGDTRELTTAIGNIQREFRNCPLLADDHPVFVTKLTKPSAKVEKLTNQLDNISPEEFLSKKHEYTRQTLATFLNMSVADLERTFMTSQSIFSQERALFRPHRRLSMGRTADQGARKKVDAKRLKCILDPLHDIQTNFIHDRATQFDVDTRKWAFKAYKRFMANSDLSHRALVMTGKAGSGKTAFAAKLIVSLPQAILGYHFVRHDDYRFRDAKSMLLELSYQMAMHSLHYRRRISGLLSEHEWSRKDLLGDNCSVGRIFADFFEKPLMDLPIPPNQKFAIIIDGIDEGKRGEAGKNEILDVVQEYFLRLPRWLVLVIMTKPRLPVLKKLRRFNAVTIEPNEEQDMADLTTYFMNVLHGRCDDYEVEKCSDILASVTNGNFLHAHLIEEKYREIEVVNYIVLAEVMSKDMDGMLGKEIGLIRPDNLGGFWSVVKICLVAMKPLHKDVVKELAGISEDIFNAIVSGASAFFVFVDSRLRFRHKALKDWLIARLSPSKLHNPRAFRRSSMGGVSAKCLLGPQRTESDELAKCYSFFSSRITMLLNRSPSFRFESQATREYILQHGVHHLALAGNKQAAVEMILNPVWLLARSNDPDAIVQCCNLLGSNEPVLQLLARAVTSSKDAIQEDSRQLLGQLVGRLLSASDVEHGDPEMSKKIRSFLENLKSQEYDFEWWCPVVPTWEQAEQPFVRQLVGHTAPVQTVAWHPDGRRCASGGWDYVIRIVDSLTGEDEHVLMGHDNTVWAIDWEPNGHRIVSGSLDHSVRVWNSETGDGESILLGHSDSVWSVKWSKDSERIASGSKDCSVRIWNFATGVEVKRLLGHEAGVYSVSWEAESGCRRLCSGAADNTIRIWDTETEECLKILRGHNDWVRSVCWSEDGRRILSGSADHTVRVWDAFSYECVTVLMGHSDCVWSVDSSPDFTYAVSASTDGTVKLWGTNKWTCEDTWDKHGGAVWSVSCSPDGKRVLSGSTDKAVIVWDTTTGRESFSLGGHKAPIWCLDVAKDGQTMATGSSDKTARLWYATNGTCQRVFTGHDGPVWGVRFCHTVARMATASADSTAAIWNINTGERLLLLTGHTLGVWDVDWTWNDARVLTGSKDTTIRLWCSSSGACYRVFNGHTDKIQDLAVSDDGRRLASASLDATIRVWDMETGECTACLRRKDAGALSVQWHKNNANVVAGYSSGCVRIWNCDTAIRDIGFLPGHTRRTNAVAYSPDCTRVVSVSADRDVRIWNVESQHCDRKFKGHTGLGITGVKWTKKNQIVSVGTDTAIRIWDAETGICKDVLAGRSGLGVYDVAWSADGSKVAAGLRDRRVQIFDAKKGNLLRTMRGHTNWVTKVMWNESGTKVLSRSDDSTTRVWDAESGECEGIYGEKTLPEGFVPFEADSHVSTSKGPTPEGEPVGLQCDRVVVNGNRACGWIRHDVYFFKLMGNDRKTSSKKPTGPTMMDASASSRSSTLLPQMICQS